MSLDVPTEVLAAAERDALDHARFLAVVRDSLPYAWQVVAAAADDRTAHPEAPFGEHAVPPPSERERGQLLRALASNAIRGALERHFGVVLAFPELPPGGRVRPGHGGLPDLPGVHQPARPGAQPVPRAARLLTPREC